ncbi:MAG: YkgJ family cysteine cluster protein [Thermoplasmata archaeon HGW-Thermoplasmata-1]|nr:MAG: YkgJ family cysteine cluster protein [Thermoplasmata archaeon HGW-Thermoplasmata-1]
MVEGMVCKTRGCRRCCLETEMMLTEGDVARLESQGFRKDEFCFESQGWLMLRNVEEHCVFLSGDVCTAYENRPDGCRHYPFVWDEEYENVVRDIDCPYHNEFRITKQEEGNLRRAVKALYREREERLLRS